MRKLFLILLFLSSYPLFAQATIRPEIQEHVNEIGGYDIYYEIYGGELDVPFSEVPKMLRAVYYLSKNANDSELIILTDHEKPIVRCYAFDALKQRKHIDRYSIMLKHLTDTASFETRLGCFGGTETVSDHFTSYEGLSVQQREKLDSIYIFTPMASKYGRNDAFRHIKPEDKYHERIREIYIKEKDLHALQTLGKFKNNQDIELITEALKNKDDNFQSYALIAVKDFPDTAFYPFIMVIHKQLLEERIPNVFIAGCFYEALVQYKLPESRDIIEQTLNTSNKKVLDAHAVAIWEALYDYPDPYFKGIQEHIKLNEEQKSRIRMFRNIP